MRILDWIIILTSPLIAYELWTSDSTSLLRFYAILWFICVLLDSINDRLKEYVG